MNQEKILTVRATEGDYQLYKRYQKELGLKSMTRVAKLAIEKRRARLRRVSK